MKVPAPDYSLRCFGMLMIFDRPEAIVSPMFPALQLTLTQVLDAAYGEN
jgi:hypothetical protein